MSDLASQTGPEVAYTDIAVIGMACRFPGANTYQAFWHNLVNGVNSISEIPPERWDYSPYYAKDPAIPDTSVSKWGGFLDQIDQFDADFFKLSPREVQRMDPQQRIVLELSWSCFEDAGYDPRAMQGSQTGVYLGICNFDYEELLLKSQHPIEGHTLTGNHASIVPNRISYLFNFQGPSLPFDTACSSSLMALHHALTALYIGDCELALVGGVSVMCTPTRYLELSHLGMLSPTGQCRVFDADADGYVRGEGAGLVLLKPLKQALIDRDPIHAVIKGSAINHGGQARTLTSPNAYAQSRVIRKAYSQTQISPQTVTLIETHGTGTPLGDPIEINGLKRAFTQLNQQFKLPALEQPYCALGAVKSNIGHLEAAAGIAGLIKVILALKYATLPQSVNFETQNPRINLDRSPFYLLDRTQPWPVILSETGDAIPRRAGLSSFGFGGANAHVVLEEAPNIEWAGITPLPQFYLLPLSGKTEAALSQLAQAYQGYLSHLPQLSSLQSFAYTAQVGRSHFERRIALIGSTQEDWIEQLQAYLNSVPSSGVIEQRAPLALTETGIAVLFTGQGSQYIGMGRDLYETQPTFKQALDQCAELLDGYLETPLLKLLYDSVMESSVLDQTGYTQPALFALEYALYQLWQSWGIQPTVVMGHSVGEYVAACVAGVFSLADGLKLIAARGRLMQQLPTGGTMVSLMASLDQVKLAIADHPDVAIAAINGPQSVVISGSRVTLQTLATQMEADGIKTKTLQVSHAFHSPLMQPMLAEFEQVAQQITYTVPQLKLISNVTGQLATPAIATPKYWCQHILAPVNFAESMQAVAAEGIQIFIECGPKPTLLGMGRQCLADPNTLWLPSLRSGQPDWQSLLTSLGSLYVNGFDLNWAAINQDYTPSCRVSLPTYPFQRQRYWIETEDLNPPLDSQQLATSPVLRLFDQGNYQQLADLLPEQKSLSVTEALQHLVNQHQQAIAQTRLSHYLYAIEWQLQPRTAPTTNSPEPSQWLIIGAGKPWSQKLVAQLEQAEAIQGLPCIEGIPPDWSEQLETLQPDQPVKLLFVVTETDPSQAHVSTLALLGLIQALLKHNVGRQSKVWVVTTGAMAYHPMALAQTPVWGLGKVIALEHPEIWGGLIDLDPTASPESQIEWLVPDLLNLDFEDQIVYRQHQRWVARLKPTSLGTGQQLLLDPRGSYLITGGTGSLGLRVAKWLVQRGACHLVLLSRQGLREPIQPEVDALVEAGATVKVLIADVANLVELESVWHQINEANHPLKGIIHAAGVERLDALTDLTADQLESVLRPKVRGGWHLHQLSQDQDLDFFVCFSSIASVWGSRGQAHYAAANQFLDGLIHYRRSLGLPGLSINWGPWAGGGMATPEAQVWLAQAGVEALSPDLALVALGDLLPSDRVQVTVSHNDWEQFKSLYTAKRPRPLLDLISPSVSSRPDSSVQPSSDQITQLLSQPKTERIPALQSLIEAQLRLVLGLKPDHTFDPTVGFFELGIDSLMAVDLRNRLQTQLGTTLPASLAFDLPNLQRLTKFLATEIGLRDDSASTPLPAQPADVALSEPIAIIGVACRFPGGANTPEAFWEKLCQGYDAIVEVPATRWNIDAVYDPDPETPGKTYCRYGGFLEPVDQFDPHVFGISPREAEYMDPQHRLLLEVSWEALERAGYSLDRAEGSATGVFVGITLNDYYQLMQHATHESVQAYGVTGGPLNAAAGRIAYTLGLTGPALAVDTACSSSLVALHQACQSLRLGECTMALAGGVNLMLTPASMIFTAQAQMLSTDGHCKTFDAAADGIGRGEGCGIVVLKRLSEAVAAGDPIQAVICTSAVNQDGPSSGFTVPNGQAQQQLIRRALAQANLSPNDISYIEAHGTGTALGDPIEVTALAEVFGRSRSQGDPLWVGSVKANIGHLESAAGISGVIKVILAMQHHQIPPHTHLHQLNPQIDWERWPIQIPTALQPWSQSDPQRLAGVSSFGASGTNAHVILAEAPELPEVEPEIEPLPERPLHLLTLSAMSQPALQELVSRYATYLEQSTEDLGSICYTANVGRRHFPYRLAIAAASSQDLSQTLQTYLNGADTPKIGQGQVEQAKSPKLAILFTGQGSQYPDMGRQLYETQPTFKQALDQCAQILDSYLDRPLLTLLTDPDPKVLDQTAYTQPVLFAIEYALYHLWQSWGIQPHAVMGHSVGEYVAACVAGVFSLEDGLKLIATRGRLMQQLPTGGSMVSLMAAVEQVRAVIQDQPEIAIAAINGPQSTVISGPAPAVQTVVTRLESDGIKTKALQVSHAFHSPLMQPMVAEFQAVAQQITYALPQIKVISNVTGEVATPAIATPDYWCQHVLAPVNFAAGMASLAQEGCEIFLECGPKPILLGMGRLCLPDEVGSWLPSLRPGPADWQQLLISLGELYVRGITINWSGFDQDYPQRHKVILPTYPFQRQRYWLQTSASNESTVAASAPPTSAIVDLLDQGQTDSLVELLAHSPRISPELKSGLTEVVAELIRQHHQQQLTRRVSDWFYQIEWQPYPLLPTVPLQISKSWIIFADQMGIGTQVAQTLIEQGHQCLVVRPGSNYASSVNGAQVAIEINLNHMAEYEQFVQELDRLLTHPLAGIIHLWALDIADPPVEAGIRYDWERSQQLGCGSLMYLLQAWNHQDQSTPLWLISRGSQVVQSSTTSIHVGQATLWGLGRSIMLEYPTQCTTLLDLDPTNDRTTSAAQVISVLQQPLTQPEQLAWRGSTAYQARLVRFPMPAQDEDTQVLLSETGTYLITGGLGALGLVVAEQLVNWGAKHLVLLSRRQPVETTQTRLEHLRAKGVTVDVAQGDVTHYQDLQHLVEDLQQSAHPLKGIIHTAGVLRDGLLQQLQWPQMWEVMAPKVLGSWNLHQISLDHALDFLILFSSAVALVGASGQSNYAAANTFLDALAGYRCAQGLPGLSINWGAWAKVGMAASMDQSLQARLEAQGASFMQPSEALTALAWLLQTKSPPHIGVMPIDWQVMGQVLPTPHPGLLSQLIPQTTPVFEAPDVSSILREIQAAPDAEKQSLVLTCVKTEVAKVMKFDPAQPLDAGRGFFEMGLDSLLASQLKNQLEKTLGLTLSATVIFNYPTIETLANHLYERLSPDPTPELTPSPTPTDNQAQDPETQDVETLSEQDIASILAEKYKLY